MHYDEKTNTLHPYQTKVERIKQLEDALERIASNSLTKAECVKLAVSLRRKEKAAKLYLADIAARYRGAIIAHLLGLDEPEISDEQDRANIGANAQALDVAIAEYCTAVGHTVEYREKLLAIRRCMAAYLLLQNICAFRAWLYEGNIKGKG